jgi:hypothetical protein
MNLPEPYCFDVKLLPMVIGTKPTEDKSVAIELDDMDMIGRLTPQPSPSEITMPLHRVLSWAELHLMLELIL